MAGVSTPATFNLTNIARTGLSLTITAVSGSGQSATVNTGFAQPLVVKVTDQFGNAVGGVNIKFSAPAKNASGSFSNGTALITGMTDASGQLSETFQANTVAGAYNVTATLAGVKVSFSLPMPPGHQSRPQRLAAARPPRSTPRSLNRW